MQPTTPTHPVEFDVDYPDRQLDRFSTFLRPLFAIPILVVLAVLGGPALGGGRDGGGLFFIGAACGLIVVPPLLTIVFREEYPRWWFDFNLAFLRFENRVMSYLAAVPRRAPASRVTRLVRATLDRLLSCRGGPHTRGR